jgi:replication factor C large subunit
MIPVMNSASSDIIYLIYGQSVDMDWVEKYRPQHLEDIVGNGPAIRQMLDWASAWNKESRPLILYGKPGTGKTSSAYALARDLGWEVVELNASDQRTKAVIEKVAGGSSTTASLTGAKRKLIILDEADNLQGNADRGGARAILDVIKNSRQPIILIANELYDLPAEIRSRCDLVQFRALQARSVAPRLKYICSAEKRSCSDTALRDIAEEAHGDMRAAVNMLYATAIGRDEIVEESLSTSRKDSRSSIFDLISGIFGRTDGETLLRMSYEVDETPETLAQWIEANVTHLKDISQVTRAYRSLSRADEYLGYTYRQQYHTLWRYATALMLLGVSDAAGGEGIHARISSPERWKRMGTYRKQKNVRINTLHSIAERLHMSQSTVKEGYLSQLGILIEKDPFGYTKEFSLDADGLNMFIHDKAKTQGVMKTIAAEEKAREKERDLLDKAEEKKRKSAEKKKEPAPVQSTLPPEPAKRETEPEEPKKTQKTLFDGF